MKNIKRKYDQPYITGTGQTLSVHNIKECDGRPCVIHAPSNHRMNGWSTHWRDDKGIMERICPHGIGHPDPDMLAYLERSKGKEYAELMSIHGCDGCCVERRRGNHGRRKASKL